MRWFLLHHVVRNRYNIKPIIVLFSIFVSRSQACSASTIYNACRPLYQTVVALYFGSDLQHLVVLRVSHSADDVLRLLAEWVERLILFQVGFQSFAIWMRFKLMNQLFDCFLAGVILLLDSSMWQSLDSEVDVTATGLSHMVDGSSRFTRQVVSWRP